MCKVFPDYILRDSLGGVHLKIIFCLFILKPYLLTEHIV